MTDESSYQDDLDGAMLQMLTQDETLTLNCRNGRFKHVEGKDGTTTFLPCKCKSKGGGTFRNVKNDKYLTEDQAKFVYKRVNVRKGINTNIIQQEMKQEKVGTEIENTYQKAILTDVGRKGKDPTQIEEWSILSDHVKYVTHDGSETFCNLNIDALNYHQN